MRIIYLFILTFFFQTALSQQIVIKGQVFADKTLLPMYVHVAFGDSITTFSNDRTGKFEIVLNERENIDSILLAGLPSFRPLMIKNLPVDNDTIELGLIPIFGEETLIAMVDFFCHPLNLKCKISEKRYFRKKRKKYERIRRESDLRAAQCKYLFQNKVYLFDTTDHTIVIDLDKPDKLWDL